MDIQSSAALPPKTSNGAQYPLSTTASAPAASDPAASNGAAQLATSSQTPATMQHLSQGGWFLGLMQTYENRHPDEAKAFLQGIADRLHSEAQDAGMFAPALNSWGDKFQRAADSGDLSNLLPGNPLRSSHFGVRAYRQAAQPTNPEADLAEVIRRSAPPTSDATQSGTDSPQSLVDSLVQDTERLNDAAADLARDATAVGDALRQIAQGMTTLFSPPASAATLAADDIAAMPLTAADSQNATTQAATGSAEQAADVATAAESSAQQAANATRSNTQQTAADSTQAANAATLAADEIASMALSPADIAADSSSANAATLADDLAQVGLNPALASNTGITASTLAANDIATMGLIPTANASTYGLTPVATQLAASLPGTDAASATRAAIGQSLIASATSPRLSRAAASGPTPADTPGPTTAGESTPLSSLASATDPSADALGAGDTTSSALGVSVGSDGLLTDTTNT